MKDEKELASALETIFDLAQENKLDKEDPEVKRYPHLKNAADEQDDNFGLALKFISGLKSGKFLVMEVYPATSSGVQPKEN
jgi:hypothetical protein